jgi:hypothetical protein
MEPQTPSPEQNRGPESSGQILPAPEFVPEGGEAASGSILEKNSAVGEVERPGGDKSMQAGPVTMPAPLPQAIVQAVTDDNVTTAIGATPDLADDVDVIEKEWVDKAKQIVAATSTDPYKQNNSVSALKADYMKKRYGKDVKLPTDDTVKA